MSNLKIFEFDGVPVTFEFQDGRWMANATLIAKHYGKLVGGFLRLKQTKLFIAALESRYADQHNGEDTQAPEALRVVQGGTPELQGTWMDERLVLKFAAWLDVRFELWVYDRIHELLTTGTTEIKPASDTPLFDEIRSVAIRLDRHEQQHEFFNDQLETVFDQLEGDRARIDDIEARILAGQNKQLSIRAYCIMHGIPFDLKKAIQWGRTASQISKERGIPKGKVFDEQYGQVGAYDVAILKEVIKP